jgi:hypothetical protein
MTKAILIDSSAREIKEVEINDYTEIAPMIDCEIFTVARMSQKTDAYVDDMGLLGSPTAFFRMEGGYPTPLAGNGLLMDTDDMGESVDVSMTLDEVKSKVVFMTPTDAHNYAVLMERGFIK